MKVVRRGRVCLTFCSLLIQWSLRISARTASGTEQTSCQHSCSLRQCVHSSSQLSFVFLRRSALRSCYCWNTLYSYASTNVAVSVSLFCCKNKYCARRTSCCCACLLYVHVLIRFLGPVRPFCDGVMISDISLARNLARNVAWNVLRNVAWKVAWNVDRNLGRKVFEDEKSQCVLCEYILGILFWDYFCVLEGTKLWGVLRGMLQGMLRDTCAL